MDCKGWEIIHGNHKPVNQCDQSIEEVLNCLMPFAYYNILCPNVLPKTYYYPILAKYLLFFIQNLLCNAFVGVFWELALNKIIWPCGFFLNGEISHKFKQKKIILPFQNLGWLILPKLSPFDVFFWNMKPHVWWKVENAC